MTNLYDLMVRPERVHATQQFVTDRCVMWDLSLLPDVQCPNEIIAPGTYKLRKNGAAALANSEHVTAVSAAAHLANASGDSVGPWKQVSWSEWAFIGGADGPVRVGGISRTEPIAANSEWLDRLPSGFHMEAHDPSLPMRIVRQSLESRAGGARPSTVVGIAMPVRLYVGGSIADAILSEL